jgi:hypothetical protein
MLVTGKIKPNRYSCGHTKLDVTVYFAENIKEKKKKVNGEQVVSYEYDRYETSIRYRPDYKKYIEDNYNILLERAKEEDRIALSKELREKRNKLLAESDCHMALDRLKLEVPDGNTFAIWKPFLKSLGDALTGDWAKYRQALRDLPNQEGFPYTVEFPKKPE